jgi:hypothetical protein
MRFMRRRGAVTFARVFATTYITWYLLRAAIASNGMAETIVANCVWALIMLLPSFTRRSAG